MIPFVRLQAASNEAAKDNSPARLETSNDRETAVPAPTMTVAEFVETCFVPEHVKTKELSGRTHYQAILKHVLEPEAVNRIFQTETTHSKGKLTALSDWPYLDEVRLCDCHPDHMQRLITAALDHGYSTQTAKHIRSVLSAIFKHAKAKQLHPGDNPASHVTLPEVTHKQSTALTLAQTTEVLRAMRYPEKEMALMAVLTGMNMSEICGLQWKYVNLTADWLQVEDQHIPAGCIAITKQLTRGRLDSLGKRSRHRLIQMPESLSSVLAVLRRRAKFTGPEDFVLVTRSGRAIQEHAIAVRRLKQIGTAMGIARLSWHALRRTHTALAYELGTHSLGDHVTKGDSAGAARVQMASSPASGSEVPRAPAD